MFLDDPWGQPRAEAHPGYVPTCGAIPAISLRRRGASRRLTHEWGQDRPVRWQGPSAIDPQSDAFESALSAGVTALAVVRPRPLQRTPSLQYAGGSTDAIPVRDLGDDTVVTALADHRRGRRR